MVPGGPLAFEDDAIPARRFRPATNALLVSKPKGGPAHSAPAARVPRNGFRRYAVDTQLRFNRSSNRRCDGADVLGAGPRRAARLHPAFPLLPIGPDQGPHDAQQGFD